MKPGGKQRTQIAPAGTLGTHATGGFTIAGAGLRRPTVAVIVEFINANVVATVVTTNWFLLIKNLFSLELWSSFVEISGRLISFFDDDSIYDEGGSKSKSKRSFEVGRAVAIKLNNREIN